MIKKFKVGDLVIVKEQPKDMYVEVKGEMAFIDELIIHKNIDYANIYTLKEEKNGSMGGSGCVPLSCLSLENDNIFLIELKKKHDEKAEKFRLKHESYINRYNKEKEIFLLEASRKIKVSKEDIELVVEMYQKFKEDVNYYCR